MTDSFVGNWMFLSSTWLIMDRCVINIFVILQASMHIYGKLTDFIENNRNKAMLGCAYR